MRQSMLFITAILLLLFGDLCICQPWQCAFSDTTPVVPIQLNNVTHNVVIFYLDFPDGRINGQPPVNDAELDQVENIDAVCFMGYISHEMNQVIYWTKKCRKYNYLDCWNRLFSENTYIGTAHPDWLSHGSHGMPYASWPPPPNQIPGDTAQGYGSVKEYFKEISYGRFEIEPIVVRPTENDYKYKTGIGNTITDQDEFGNRYIIPVLLYHNKSSTRYDNGNNTSTILADAPAAIHDRTGFDVGSFTTQGGRVVIIFAGSTANFVGGETVGNISIVREKLTANTQSGNSRSVIEGISVTCHEYAHTLGWGHTGLGAYDIMNTGTDMQNCPPHPNMVIKLQAGLILPSEVYKINTPFSVENLTPSIFLESEKRCAVVTVYGKAGYDDNYFHSEYYVLENRRMIWDNSAYKFDKKLVWRTDLIPAPPVGFEGGILVYRYAYNSFSPENSRIGILPADRILENGNVGDGHHRDFYGVNIGGDPPIITFILENKTLSSYNLQTGIRFNNIEESQETDDMNFDLIYSLGSPPDYDKLFYGQTITEPLNLGGAYFVHQCPFASNVIINPGAIFDCRPAAQFGVDVNLGAGNLYAVGTTENPILFRGMGYSVYRTGAGGLVCKSTNNVNQDAIEIRNIDFEINSILTTAIYILNQNSHKNINIENININGSGSINITAGNSNFTTSMDNINYGGEHNLRLEYDNCDGTININSLNSTGNAQCEFLLYNCENPLNLSNIISGGAIRKLSLVSNAISRSQFNYFSNTNFNNLAVSGLWNFNLPSDLMVPSGACLRIQNKGGNQINDINFTTPSKIVIDGTVEITGNFNYNRDLIVSSLGLCKITAFDGPELSFNNVKFSQGYGLKCDGQVYIDGLEDNLYLTVNSGENWVGILCQNPGSVFINNAKIMNAVTGVQLDNPQGSITIQNSHFSDNVNYDILIKNFSQSAEEQRLIKNNIFVGNEEKISAIYCNNGANINIEENNRFQDDYNNGISLTYVTNPVVKQNTFQATTTPGYSPKGIYSYTSGGFYSCNDLTNYSNAVELNNSSPYLFNNDIYNNGIGLYCVSASYPILTPAYSPGGTLYIGGYNRIHDNLEAEIHCENTIFIPNSLPVLGDGYNSIYDNNTDCLIDLTGISSPIEYNVQNNYWGGGSPQNRLCPPSFTFVYEPYLSDEPQPPPYCEPLLQSANNSGMSQYTLQLGSANIDDYNGNYNSAVTKYKNLIAFTNNPRKSYLLLAKIFYSTSKDTNADFYSLESYYSGLSNQYSTDTLFRRKSANVSTSADVEQPSYQEAIGEYQAIIDNPLNPVERHYAYIDQMRTIRLMLDSLLNGNGNGPMGGNYNHNELNLLIQALLNFRLPESGNLSVKNQDQKDKPNVSQKSEIAGKFVSTNSSRDKQVQLDNIKKTLNIENISFDNLSNHEKVKLLDKVLSFKLLEFSLLNNSANTRPLSRMSMQKRNSVQVNSNIPKVFKLHQNYPNPFNPVCAIKFDIPKESMVTIKIYDLLGKEITTLVNEVRQAGYYEALFDGSNYASGVYFYRIEARQVGSLTGGYVNVKKMVLMK